MDETTINELIADLRKNYPPIITLDQAAEIAQVPLATIYEWSSRGHLDPFKLKAGRHKRLGLDNFVRYLAREK